MEPTKKTVTHSKPVSTTGGAVRMPKPQPTPSFNLGKRTCSVCPGAKRAK